MPEDFADSFYEEQFAEDFPEVYENDYQTFEDECAWEDAQSDMVCEDEGDFCGYFDYDEDSGNF